MAKTINFTVPKNADSDTSVQVVIPSPILSIDSATNTIKVSQPDPVVTQALIEPPPVAKTFSFEQIPFSDPDFVAENRGANMFYNSLQRVPLPTDANEQSLDNEKRFTWSELQPSTSTGYVWTNFDNAVNSCIDKGQRFSFGIMPLESGSGTSQSVGGNLCCFPTFLHTAMQAEAVKDWASGGMWIPNWNSNVYLIAWENFQKALAQHIASTSYKSIAYTNVISRVCLLGFGNWGEWHTASAGRGSWPTGTKATSPTLKRIIDSYLNYFPNFPLMIPIGAYGQESYPDVAYYALTSKNNWGEIGWGKYSLGINGTTNAWATDLVENNAWTYNNIALKNLILNKWKVAPIGGEPMNDQAAVTINGQIFGDLERQVRLYHVSNFNNQTSFVSGSTIPATVIPNVRAASKACGYRIGITGGNISGRSVTLNWTNTGIAPVYENWEVYLLCGATLVKSSLDLKKFLPGNQSVTDVIPDGAFNIWVIIKDPTGYRKPLHLDNKNRLTDGSYLITNI